MLPLLAALAFQCPDGSPPPCRTAARTAAINPSSVAVLYFETPSRDSSDAQLAAGLTEELITRLSQVERLEVKSRYESRRVRGSTEDPREIGRTLHAAYLVSGSIQQSGSRVRLNVALLRTASGAQVWGDVFDRVGEDALTIQSNVAREVAGAITGRLLPAERATLDRRGTRDPVAYDLYLRGVAAANTLTEGGMRRALTFFQQAIARDSGFADAWAQIGAGWMWLADGYVVAGPAYTRAREAAQRALRLDSTQATAYGVLSAAAQALDFDAEAIARWGSRGVVANPRDPFPRIALSGAYEMQGRWDEASRTQVAGFLLDTLSASTAYMVLVGLNNAGLTDSIEHILPRTAGALTPEDRRVWEGVVRWRRGDAAGAAERLNWRFYGGTVAGQYVAALVALGRRASAEAVRDSATEEARTRYFNPLAVASMNAALGDSAQALAWLDRAYDERTVWLMRIGVDPVFDFLRHDSRFIAFLRRIRYQGA